MLVLIYYIGENKEGGISVDICSPSIFSLQIVEKK